MKKIFIAAIALLGLAQVSQAETITIHKLQVNTTAGNCVEYEFDSNPVLTFEGADMTVTTDEGITVYPEGDVHNMTFTTAQKEVGVQTVAAGLSVSFTGGYLNVSGLEPGAEVSIFTASGVKVATATAGADGAAQVGIASLQAGVYIATMPGHSVKFAK